VKLPLERLIPFGEPGDLRLYQPVELCFAHVAELAVLDPPVTAEPDGPSKWSVALDGRALGKVGGYVRPQLSVVEVEQDVRLS
jgi:hypothetical protein